MSNSRDTDIDAATNEEVFEEAKDRHQMSLEGDTHNRLRAKNAMLFREGENHWDSDYVSSASEEHPELVINLTDTLVGRVVNSIADLETRGKCHPVADGADTERADVINGLGRHVEYRSDAPVAYDNGTDNAVTGGWGWWRLLGEWAAQDSFDKEIRIAPIFDCFTVYPDPGAIMPTAQDMRWCLIALMQKRTEFKRLNPGVDLVAWNDIGSKEYADWETKEEIRIAQYFRIVDKAEKLYQLSTSDGRKFGAFKSQMPTDAQLRRIQAQITGERDGTRSEVQLFHLSGTKVTQREVLPGTYIPVVRCQGNARMIDGKIWRRGMVETMQDPQRMVDYGETAKILRLGLATKSKYIAAEGQLDGHPEWTDSNRDPIPTLTYKPVTIETGQGATLLPPPQPIPPAQVEAGFTEFVQGMRSNLLAIAGMPNEPGQDQSQGQTVSGRALQRRDKLSDQSHSQYYKNKKLAVAHTWRIMLEWFPAYYSEDRMQRIIGGDGKPQMVALNKEMTGADGVKSVKNDLSVGKYDVVMEAGPSYETMREQGAESLLELMSSPPIAELITKTGPDLLMRSMDFEYAEELADRLAAQTPDGLKKIMENLPKEARAVVQSLSAQNQQLKQALDEAQKEIKYGIQKAHLAATVKAHDVEETNATRRADTESRERTAVQVEAMRGHVTLAKEEIAVGGELLNTHVEAAHNRVAAKDALKAAESAEKTNGAA